MVSDAAVMAMIGFIAGFASCAALTVITLAEARLKRKREG